MIHSLDFSEQTSETSHTHFATADLSETWQILENNQRCTRRKKREQRRKAGDDM